MSEKSGGVRKVSKSQKDFAKFVETSNLIDIITSNGFFTWNNRRLGFTNIAERLDRFLVLEDWLQVNAPSKAMVRSILISNHFSVELQVEMVKKQARGHFKFQKMWLCHEGLMELMKMWWNEPSQWKGTKMFVFHKKLCKMKENLKY